VKHTEQRCDSNKSDSKDTLCRSCEVGAQLLLLLLLLLLLSRLASNIQYTPGLNAMSKLASAIMPLYLLVLKSSALPEAPLCPGH
jgi:hypothetical protein